MFPHSNSMGLSSMPMHMLHDVSVCVVCIVGGVVSRGNRDAGAIAVSCATISL